MWVLKLDPNEKEILESCKWPDQKALDKLVLLYLPQMENKIPRLYRRWVSVPSEDLIQEAVVQIYKRHKKFDPSRASFSFFANWCIRLRLHEYCQKTRDVVSLPKVDPTVSERKSQKKIKNFKNSLSLNVSIGKGREESWIDFLSAGEPRDPKFLFWDILERELDQREKDILRMRLEGYEVKEIVKVFGITRQRIHQIRNEAYQKLRIALKGALQDHL